MEEETASLFDGMDGKAFVQQYIRQSGIVLNKEFNQNIDDCSRIKEAHCSNGEPEADGTESCKEDQRTESEVLGHSFEYVKIESKEYNSDLENNDHFRIHEYEYLNRELLESNVKPKIAGQHFEGFIVNVKEMENSKEDQIKKGVKPEHYLQYVRTESGEYILDSVKKRVKTQAQRQKEYRERKKLKNPVERKTRKTNAEYQRKYREKRKEQEYEYETLDSLARKKADAERVRRYRERKKLEQQTETLESILARKKADAERVRRYRERKKQE